MMKSRRSVVRAFLCAALAVAAVGLSACASQAVSTGQAPPTTTATPAQTPAQKLTALAVTVDKHCQVGMPFLATLKLAQTDQSAIALVDKVQTDAGKVCDVVALIAHPPADAVIPTLDLATVKTFVDSRVPDLIPLVDKSSLNDTQKTAAKLAISGIQLALLSAVVNAQ